MISLIHNHHLSPVWFHVSIWCVPGPPPSVDPCLVRLNPVNLMHQCPKLAVLASVLSPMLYVAFALANCLTGQPLKTTMLLSSRLPAWSSFPFLFS
jgi:hypothetical protein